MVRCRSLAVLVLMLLLSVAPSLAWAAAVCAPHCCPAAAVLPTDGAPTDGASADGVRADGAAPAARDCREGFANRSCCTQSLAPVSLPAPVPSDAPPLALRSPALEPIVAAPLCAPERRSEARRALRTSPLRLSVVLRI